MKFFEQPPSKQWIALLARGEKLGEVWFKPDDDPYALTLRILRQTFAIPGVSKQLTLETFLKALAILPEQVESWQHGEVTHAGLHGSNPEFRSPLPAPGDAPHLEIHVRLTPPETVPLNEPVESEAVPAISAGKWQELDARWKSILGLESTMDGVRISMEGTLAEMEASLKRPLSMEEKNHARRADISDWTKAKSRVHMSLPKVKDFIHRSIWAMGAPERKRLEEIYKENIQPQIPFPHIDEVLRQLEQLQKDRQVLSAVGKSVAQEAKAILANVQTALRTLQNNAANNAKKQRDAAKGGKFFKDLRKLSGA